MARLLLVVLVSLVSSPVLASPIAWAWAGTVTDDTGLHTMPVGTPLKLTYFADSSAPNGCGAGAAMGLYTGGHAVLDVQSTMGAVSYTANASYLFINAFGTAGCGLVAPVSELRLSDWSGPSIPCLGTCSDEQKVNPTFVGLAPGGLFFLGSPLSGPAFPTQQPASAYLQGPWFGLSELGMAPPFQRAITSWDMSAVPVPEPGTWLLFGAGLCAVAVRMAVQGRRLRAAR
jgi:hypothetical protein